MMEGRDQASAAIDRATQTNGMAAVALATINSSLAVERMKNMEVGCVVLLLILDELPF